MIIEKWRANESKIKRSGPLAIEAARKAGVPAYYRDLELGEGIVKEMPDGSRHLVEIVDGKDLVRKTFGPRS